MAQLTRLTPHHWFLRGVDDISTGGDMMTASASIAILAIIGLITGSIGLWRARRVVVG